MTLDQNLSLVFIHYAQQNLENTKFDFFKHSLIRKKFGVRWNK